MIRYFTNREIAKKLDINLARWKRWSRAFLPPDPLGGLQSGYARQYTFKDLVKVVFGGYLVGHLKLSFPDSQLVLADLTPWLKRAGFLELNGSIEMRPLAVSPDERFSIYLRRLSPANEKSAPGYAYLIRHTVSTPSHPSAGGTAVTETHHDTFINGQLFGDNAFFDDPEVHWINLTALFARLVEKLSPRD